MPVPGLPDGLTHAFPEPGTVTSASLAAAGIEGADAMAVAALAANPDLATDPAQAGPGAPEHSGDGLDRDLHEYLAFRLGRTEAFPLVEPALRAALADLGLVLSGPGPGPWAEPWRPWLALAAAHLMAHGDTLSSLVPA
jgi:AraC family transcriptional regulator of adaptative response / DNA-3-methyladenine glycosylase II